MFKVISTAFLCLSALCSAGLNAQGTGLTLDQVVQKHIDAQGGTEKINAIQTMKATGNASLMGGQVEAPLTMIMKRPNSMRMEMSVQGQSLVQAFDGTTGWMINPFIGSNEAQKSSDEDNKTMKDDTDFIGGPLYDYKAKGSTLQLIGKEDLDGTPVYKVRVDRKSGTAMYVYIDAQTFLVIRSAGRRRQMGQDLDLETTLGNYKQVNGVMMPFTIDQKNQGQPLMHYTIDKVEVNVPTDDSMFRMPEKPKEKAEPKPSEKEKSPEKP